MFVFLQVEFVFQHFLLLHFVFLIFHFLNENNQPGGVEDQNNDQSQTLASSDEKNDDNQSGVIENTNTSAQEIQNDNQINENKQVSEDTTEKKEENGGSGHQVIHKKDGRLHIYVRQDKYKGELKSKNWVGRLYIDGKQKISSSGTTNLEEAIPILEKWFDDVHEESEKLKNQVKETENNNEVKVEENIIQNNDQVVSETPKIETTAATQTNENNIQNETSPVATSENPEPTKQELLKGKLTNIFGKLKDIKLKKPSFANNLNKLSSNKSKVGSFKSKFENFFKSKLGKSTVQGEEILGVELANKEIRLVQVSSNKANQWVLDKLHIHPVDISDDSTPIDNADKFSEELSLAIQKYKNKYSKCCNCYSCY